jgi:elongation factor P--(R)-beta-lysine ligase
MTNAADRPWWDRDRHAGRRPQLLARGRIQTAMRAWFQDRDFVEVDPAALAISPGNEAHLHGFATTMIGNDGQGQPRFLHTSPEFAMKKLLAAGETRIHAFSHVWRNRERGPLHSPEFTLLEWYRVDEDYQALMQDVADLARLACDRAGSGLLRYSDRVCDPALPPERLGVVEAFETLAGINLLATFAPDGTPDVDALRSQMGPLRATDDDTWSDLFARVLVTHVEPNLGQGRLTILDRYPAAEAALARRLPQDRRLAERFEVYACGVELANGFGELTDPVEQRARFIAEMEEKARVYGERYPLDEDLLQALAQMPAASGIALGFDRLVMLATHAPTVEHVMWTPVP